MRLRPWEPCPGQRSPTHFACHRGEPWSWKRKQHPGNVATCPQHFPSPEGPAPKAPSEGRGGLEHCALSKTDPSGFAIPGCVCPSVPQVPSTVC